MADYYPLIAKAVSGLEKSTGEVRRALYDRARTALLAQLRGVEPPLAEPDITRERLSLEEAIRKVETEAARRSRSDPPPPPPSRVEPPSARAEPPLRVARQATITPPAPAESAETRPQPMPARQSASLSAAAVRTERRPPLPPPPTIEDEAAEEQDPEETPVAKAPRPERPRWSPGSGPSLSDKGLKGFRDVVAEAESLGGATAQAAKNVRAAYQPVPGELERTERLAEARTDARADPRTERHEPRVEPPPQRPQRRPSPRDAERLLGREPLVEPNREPREPREPPRARDVVRDLEPPRPASRRIEPPPLDDEPDDFAEPDSFARDDAFPPPRPQPPPVKPEYPTRAPSSMVRQEDVRGRTPVMPRAAKPERKPALAKRLRPLSAWKVLATPGIVFTVMLAAVALLIWWQRGPIISLFQGAPGLSRSVDSTAPGDSGARAKISDRVGSGSFGSPGEDTLVAQKAVLYEEDASNPSGRQFVGTAVWRTDRVAPAPGQAPELAIRADVDIPEQRLSLTWSLRRNNDKSLPASHTVEIMFTLPPDFPHGGIANIPGVLMKQGESTRGVALAGLAVKVTTNVFLIGLSSADADMQRNIQLLKERPWFDIPIVYGDGQRAIIAIEKGTPGERSFAEAFASWGR
jgi:hypothetical protein